LYFAASYLLLERHYRFELAWLSVALAAFFFAFTRVLQRRTGISGALYDQLYLALGVGFLTVAIPLKLGEHWLTLAGWWKQRRCSGQRIAAGACCFASWAWRRWLWEWRG
jgi:hypothetical protein